MPAYFELTDLHLNRQFARFRQPEPGDRRPAIALAFALLAEAADARRHGDHGAALAAEMDARRMARAAARKAVSA